MYPKTILIKDNKNFWVWVHNHWGKLEHTSSPNLVTNARMRSSLLPPPTPAMSADPDTMAKGTNAYAVANNAADSPHREHNDRPFIFGLICIICKCWGRHSLPTMTVTSNLPPPPNLLYWFAGKLPRAREPWFSWKRPIFNRYGGFWGWPSCVYS